ncbi:MAG: site-specific DNA-methyltransferase [Vampirovibrionales bacterium]
MNTKKTKLELTWIGKEQRPRLEPRILLADPTLSHHAPHKVTENDLFDNRLIFGDNLLALKALEQEFAGKVKCIYIDPPYNTGNAFEHYDDGLEHSIWLGLMRDRLELLWRLLSTDGLMAIQIDDNEFARLYLMLCEICGEKNLKTICVKMSEATGVKMASVNKMGSIAKLKEFIILAGKSGIKGFNLERIAKEKWDSEYKSFVHGATKEELSLVKGILEDESRSQDDVNLVDSILAKLSFENVNDVYKREFGKNVSEDWLFSNAWRIVQFATITGGAKDLAVKIKLSTPTNVTAFSIVTARKKMYAIKRSFNHETELPRCKLLFADQYLQVHPGDFWHDIKTTGLDNEGGIDFKNGKKPEALIKRIIGMCTNTGDLVLDSFAGSGTTGAVAHKMGRRWIMVELGEHCHTHIIPRLKKVIDGTDQGGISKTVNWQGGGGFRYYKLAGSLLEKDHWGNWVISKQYNPAMLTEALCKLEGFTYAPSDTIYWQQGYSTESDYIYVTTQTLSAEQLQALSDEVGTERSLLVLCSAFKGNAERFSNLTIKKIPRAVLAKCEWGHDDYSLNVENLPMAEKLPENVVTR